MDSIQLSSRGRKIASCIDHTLLKVGVTTEEIINHCNVAHSYQFFSVCIPPHFVSLAAHQLKESSVKVCSVVGFPTGATLSSVKAYETEQLIKEGADEIDMVLSVSSLKNGDLDLVTQDIQSVVQAAAGKKVKVIFENCLLSPLEIQQACQCSSQAGAHFVKTSTGFSTGGAKIEDVKLMKQNILKTMEVKASGGIRNLHDAEKMIEAGATRLGTSASVTIVTGGENTGVY